MNWVAKTGATSHAPARYVTGALYGLAAVSIWAGWSAFTRLAVTTKLDAWDITALRFGVAAVVLAPLLVRRGLATDRLGRRGLLLLVAGGGAPYVMLAAGGLRYAPAHDQAALNPGFAPLFVALIGMVFLGEAVERTRRVGLALILAAALLIVFGQGAAWTGTRTLGHALFLSAALLWACFTVVMRHADIAPLHATALVSVGSALVFLPVYLAVHGMRLLQLPVGELAWHAVFQGIVVTILSLLFYGRAVARLGAAKGAAFGALVPALSALLAIPLLGEWPQISGWIAIVLVSIGVYLASGGPLPRGENR